MPLQQDFDILMKLFYIWFDLTYFKDFAVTFHLRS